MKRIRLVNGICDRKVTKMLQNTGSNRNLQQTCEYIPVEKSVETVNNTLYIQRLSGKIHIFTTFCGVPLRYARMFSTTVSSSRWRLSTGAQAMWGVMIHFLVLSKGLSSGIGS